MSFPVALQSAIFYFVACTPCAKVRHRQKAKEKAKREREAKVRFEMEQPGLYQHPSPFNTNPFWQDEITRGPALPKKSGSKNSSQRGLTSSSARDGSSSLSVLDQTAGPGTGTTHTDANNSSTIAASDEDGVSADWNRRHGYQREDEELWGEKQGAHKLKDAFSKARDSAGRLIESTLGLEKEVTEQERRDFYFSPRNPPVNDYHPPVVSNKPGHKDAHQWMLQPPPPAKVMEGKVPVSRAMSSASRSSLRVSMAGEEAPLRRLVQDKAARSRTRTRATSGASEPTEQELIESLFENRPRSLARSRSLSLDNSDESFDNPFHSRDARLRPLATPPQYESSDDEPAAHPSRKDSNGSHQSQAGRAAQRPKLPTILSADSKSSSRSSLKMSRRQQRSTKMKALSGTASPVGDDTE